MKIDLNVDKKKLKTLAVIGAGAAIAGAAGANLIARTIANKSATVSITSLVRICMMKTFGN